MKKNLLTAALLITASLTAFTGCSKKSAESADLLTQVKSKGQLTIAMEGDWAPWTYHDENNNLVGFDVEVGKAIAEKLGVTANFVEVDWDGIFAGIDSKRYDIACNGVEITDERTQKYDFSEPYAFTHTALIVRKDNDTIKTFEDLKGHTSTNSLGSTYATLGEKYGATVITIDSFAETLELVLHGRADATLNDNATFYYYQKVQPENDFKVACLTQDTAKVAIPMRKGAETENFRAAVNNAIAELNADGTLGSISVKYFGEDITK